MDFRILKHEFLFYQAELMGVDEPVEYDTEIFLSKPNQPQQSPIKI